MNRKNTLDQRLLCCTYFRADVELHGRYLYTVDLYKMSDAQSIRDGASSVASMSSSTTARHASKTDQATGGSRRMSVSRRPSVAGLSHQSIVGGRQGQQQSTVKFENTYRMQPDERHRFQPTMVSKILGSCTRKGLTAHTLIHSLRVVPRV